MAFTYTNASYNVSGKYRENFYSGCGGSNGDTFVVGMNSVKQVVSDPPTTGTDLTWSVANSTPSPGFCTLTIGAGAPFTGLNVRVTGT